MLLLVMTRGFEKNDAMGIPIKEVSMRSAKIIIISPYMTTHW
jgi:hypothetical protein